MELHDDDPDHFEFVLKFIYDQDYDRHTIDSVPGNSNELNKINFMLGLYKVADKYDVRRLPLPTVAHLQEVLNTVRASATLVSIVGKFYDFCLVPQHAAGKVIASTIISSCRSFVRSRDFTGLLASYPVFASDIALEYHKEGMFSIRRFKCYCGKLGITSDPADPRNIMHAKCSYSCTNTPKPIRPEDWD
jgi:hypothetical protein